ncbi:MAG TPA: TMEM165/GDT1 family protein [Steroidobacteraceae bacterium]|nr:TMEM165/GDT1 family protein [Steroidobacteraceae bacterium]
MTLEALLVSTASVAVGELGDKTQLLSLILASRLRRPVPIIAGIFVATLGNHLLACWFGEWVGTLITPQILRWVLGVSFIAVAIWALIPDKMDDEVESRSAHGVFVFTIITFFLAEMGDKTQVVAVALAARYHDLLQVVTGTTLGMMLVNIPTVLFADRAVRWIPLKLVRVVAAVIYTVLGIATLMGYQGLLPS